MPIDYRIDHGRKLVVARGHGTLVDGDVFGYQHDVWSRPEVAGYDELIDMTHVKEVLLPSPDRVRDLATVSASMDVAGQCTGKLAIVAPEDLAFGLGRMYQTYRGLNPQSTKEVGVFRTARAALDFLKIAGELEPWEPAGN